jgi:hypothetical protein
MPFNPATGVYTAPAAATDAFPGKVIASADWNSIFTDIQNGITSLGQQNWTQNPRVINVVGSFNVATTDAVIFVQASAPTITLPLSSTKPFPVRIIGAMTGIFGTNNSSVVPTSTDKISGLTTVLLNVDFQMATFYPLASGGYVVSYS